MNEIIEAKEQVESEQTFSSKLILTTNTESIAELIQQCETLLNNYNNLEYNLEYKKPYILANSENKEIIIELNLENHFLCEEYADILTEIEFNNKRIERYNSLINKSYVNDRILVKRHDQLKDRIEILEEDLKQLKIQIYYSLPKVDKLLKDFSSNIKSLYANTEVSFHSIATEIEKELNELASMRLI